MLNVWTSTTNLVPQAYIGFSVWGLKCEVSDGVEVVVRHLELWVSSYIQGLGCEGGTWVSGLQNRDTPKTPSIWHPNCRLELSMQLWKTG